MSWVVQSRTKRKRNKSGSFHDSTEKKHKAAIPVVYENSDSELETSINKGKMADKLSKDDLKELVAILGKEIKKDLIKELKKELVKKFKDEVVKIVHIETSELKEEIAKLQKENKDLKESINSNFLYADELEQYSRKMCLDISGIPGDIGDKNENVAEKILIHVNNITLKSGVRLKLDPSDIDKCHRKGKWKDEFLYNRKSIIKFTNSSARQMIYDARKELGSGIFVQENITPHREKVAYEGRQLVRAKILTKCWVAGCKVYGSIPSKIPAEKTETKVHIRDMNIIEAIKNGTL